MRIFCTSLLVATLLGSTLTLRAESEMITGINAVVHDSVITFQEVEFYTAPIAEELRRKYQGQPDLYNRELAKAVHENLEQMMNQQIILHEFERAGYKIPESIIDQAVQERIRSKVGNDRAKFTRSLQAEGMTFEQFRKQVRNQIIIGAMQHNFVSSATIISPHKIEAYYAAHQDDFKLGDQVKLRMIVLNRTINGDDAQAKGLAEDVLSQLKDGAAFDQMATVYSQGSQASQGGDWGWKEIKILRKELADVAASLKSGERSGVVETPDAYYIMLVEDKQPTHVSPLKEVRPEIEKILASDETARLTKQWLDKLREKTFVRLY